MLKIKPDVSINEANTLLHSLAVVLDEDSRDRFYGHMQHARDRGDPQKIVEAVLGVLAERSSDGTHLQRVQQQGG